MTKFPRDRFDDVDDGPRVGAHRGLPRRGRGWIMVGWAALACAVLVVIGIVALEVANQGIQFTDTGSSGASASASATTGTGSGSTASTPEPTAAPSDQPKGVTVTVLNGTATAGLAATGTATLENAGWVIASDGNAGSQDAKTTIVYYQDDAQAAVARGIVRTLGVGTVAKSSAFPNSDVTVVLGTDYAG